MISGNWSLLFAFLVFVASITVFMVIGVSALTVFLKVRARRQRRLARVSTSARQKNAYRDEVLRQQTNRMRNKRRRSAAAPDEEASSRIKQVIADLVLRLSRARIEISLSALFAILTLAGIILALPIFLALRPPFLLAVVMGLGLAWMLLEIVVRWRIARSKAQFLAQLPEALDSIIRGTRSGVSVVECIRTVARDFDAPIKLHFQAIADWIHLGEKVDVAVWREAAAIELPEMDFFANVIAIQTESGGSLSEVLGKLSDLLRKRKQLRLKIKAASGEAKASAIIIGSLPFVLALLLLFVSPDYLSPLFVDPVGNILLGIGGLSLAVGFFVMYRLTKFKV